MLKLDQMAIKALEGRTLHIGSEPVVFERSSSEPAPSGRMRQLPIFRAGSEALVAKVQFRHKRHALKLMLQPSLLRLRRIAFLERLKLHSLGLPALSAAPLLSCHGILSGSELGLPASTKLELLGYLAEFVEPSRQLKEFMRPSNPDWDALSHAARVRLAAQLASAVLMLERCQLVHGDLQPGNLLLMGLNTAEPELRIIDFDGFYYPDPSWAPVLPEDGGRVLGFHGYMHPSIQKSRLVRSDRMALAVLIFEIVALRCRHLEVLSGHGLFRQSELNSGQLQAPEEVRALWPEGWALLQRALKSSSYETEAAAPGEWLNALADFSTAPAAPRCMYHLCVILPNGGSEYRVSVSANGSKPGGGLLSDASPELAWLRYDVSDADGAEPRLRLYGTVDHPAIFRFREDELCSKRQEVEFDARPGDLFRWKGFQILVELRTAPI